MVCLGVRLEMVRLEVVSLGVGLEMVGLGVRLEVVSLGVRLEVVSLGVGLEVVSLGVRFEMVRLGMYLYSTCSTGPPPTCQPSTVNRLQISLQRCVYASVIRLP